VVVFSRQSEEITSQEVESPLEVVDTPPVHDIKRRLKKNKIL
jgi:hypothetical protein